jgi:membrane-bound lytic murein transglycosylase B
MIRIFLTLGLLLATPFCAAETYAGRDDVRAFVTDMQQRHGFDEAALTKLFDDTKPIAAAIRFIMPPKDPGIRSWQTYRQRFIEPKRIAAGRQFMAKYRADLARAEARWGVPAEIIAGIIGVETIYGRNTGRFGTFATLTTLAFDYPPRAELFRRELEELLLLARDEQRDVRSYSGSYAGALGLPQFLPSSRRRYAVDFDGDQRIDLLSSPVDAIGSVANFLSEHGWRSGEPIAERVHVSGEALAAAVAGDIFPSRTPNEWRNTGLEITKVGAGGTAHSDLPELPSAVVEFVTPDAPTEYRLGYRNFYVITRYNRSSFYAAAVMDLAAELSSSR